jgi:hypothetical protein
MMSRGKRPLEMGIGMRLGRACAEAAVGRVLSPATDGRCVG